MKKMRLPLYIALGVTVLGLILGSFLDLRISQGLGASASNGFAIGVSAIAPTFGFAAIAFIGGGFFALGMKPAYRTLFRVLFYIAAAGCLGMSVYFAGKEYFGENGFAGKAPMIVGYLIALVVLTGVSVGGYFVLREVTHPYAWVIYAIALGVAFIALVPGVTLLKIIFHRPRYRALVLHEGIGFHGWWKPCFSYKQLMAEYNLTSEEFKSFPSGHSCEISLLFLVPTFLPIVSEKIRKIQIPLFICAALLALLTMFCRILAAAHFLSDVSVGAMLIIVFAIIANEIIIHNPKLSVEAE